MENICLDFILTKPFSATLPITFVIYQIKPILSVFPFFFPLCGGRRRPPCVAPEQLQVCGSSPAGRRAAAGPGATFKGRVIPGWSLPSPRSPAAAGSPPPPRSLSAPEGGERSGRQVFPLVLFECVGPPHHSLQFHPLAFQHTDTAAGWVSPDQLLSEPSPPPSAAIAADRRVYFFGRTVFFLPASVQVGFPSARLPMRHKNRQRHQRVCGPPAATDTLQHWPFLLFLLPPH